MKKVEEKPQNLDNLNSDISDDEEIIEVSQNKHKRNMAPRPPAVQISQSNRNF